MGSPFQLVFYASDSAGAQLLAGASFRLVDSLNLVFSDYIDSSALNRLSAQSGSGQFVSAHPLLFQLISTSMDAAKQSKGAFDITVGPLSRLWRQARRTKQFPSPEAIHQAQIKTGWQHVVLDTFSKKIKLAKPGMQLDLGGIAKGYIAEEVIRFLQKENIGSALVDAGGDIVCSGPPPGKKGWTVGISLPMAADSLLQQPAVLAHGAIASSGDLYQYMEQDGKKYSHIIDPRTGYGVTFQRNVTVVAADGGTADWLATACSILSIHRSRKLARKQGAALLVTRHKNGRLLVHRNRKMKRLLGNNSFLNFKTN